MRISDWSSDVCSSDLNCAAIKAFSSTLILTSLTPLVAYSAHTFSMTGVSCLHGPHHSAQKSTITSDVRDGSTTSRRNSSTASLSLSRSEEHTSELQSLMRISYAVFCLQKKTPKH